MRFRELEYSDADRISLSSCCSDAFLLKWVNMMYFVLNSDTMPSYSTDNLDYLVAKDMVINGATLLPSSDGGFRND